MNSMKPNHEVIKKLLTKHIEVIEYVDRLAHDGVHVSALDCLDLFEMAMDLVGFPPDAGPYDFQSPVPHVTQETITRENFSREHWNILSSELKVDELDVFIERLYIDYNELRISYPHLFAEN